MSKKVKQWMADEIRTSFGGAEACLVIEYKRLPAAISGKLRTHLRSKGVRFEVVRRRVASHAVAGGTVAPIASLLKGQVAIAAGGEDPVSLAKALMEGVRGNADIQVKGGFVEGRLVTGKEVLELSKLPGKPELLSMIASAVAAPMTNIALGVNAILTGVALAVSAVHEKKEKESAVVA
jgi:large subunit ribosomal protein L10